MGLLKKLKKVVTSPKKLTTAVLTGGASVVAPKVFKPLEKVVGNTLYNTSLATSVLTKGAVSAGPSGGSPMALNIGGLLGGVGQALQGLQGANVGNVRAIGGILSGVGAGLAQPVSNPTFNPMMRTQMAAAGPVMRVGAAVTRGFFAKFPNLATQIQAFRNAGMNQVTRARLYSMLKRFGPELLISGGILTAAAVSELMMAGPGHRRMNAGNAKALRRSMRRIESFHRLCVRADSLRAPRRRAKPCRSAASTQFVRQG